MHLIVAEKNISARRIAQILAGGKKVTEKKDAGVSVYQFGETAAIDSLSVRRDCRYRPARACRGGGLRTRLPELEE